MSQRTAHTVLIVDDDRVNRLALAELLHEECRVVLAGDGLTALQRCQEEAIDLILLDISMPQMNGLDVMRQLQASERTADIAVIFITGLTSEDDEEQGLLLGAIDYIGKPIHSGIALARIRNHLKLISPRALASHAPSAAEPPSPVPSGGLPSRKLTLVKEFIETHLEDAISLEMIAQVAGISASHFTELFKQSTAQSPHQYVMMRRIEKAKDLLTNSDLSISEIALQCGFADQSHLTRLMRRHTGMTPRQLRRN